MAFAVRALAERDPDEPTGVSAVAPTMTLDEVNVAHEKAIEEKVKALGAPEI